MLRDCRPIRHRQCATVTIYDYYISRELNLWCEPVWPSGKALLRLVSRRTSVRIRFGSHFSSKVEVCGHCLVTLSLTISETLKWLSSLPTFMQESFWRWQCSDRYIICLSPHLHTPFSPSVISHMVSVDVKHYVYLLTKFVTNERSKSPYANTIHCIFTPPPPKKKKQKKEEENCCKHTFYQTTHPTSPCVDTVGVTQGPHHPTLPAGRQITSLFVQRFESRGSCDRRR